MSVTTSAGRPTIQGYLVIYVISAVLSPLPVAVVAFAETLPSNGVLNAGGAALVLTPLSILVALVCGVPAGVLGAVTAHALLGEVRSLRLQVTVFAVLGVLAGWAYDAFLFGGFYPWLPWSLGTAAALGRAGLARCASRRPVDDDSRPVHSPC